MHKKHAIDTEDLYLQTLRLFAFHKDVIRLIPIMEVMKQMAFLLLKLATKRVKGVVYLMRIFYGEIPNIVDLKTIFWSLRHFRFL
ncbi:MAG: hypothetical protein AB2823_13025 [Candidatus Thiodiazotropha endolucinida]